MPTPEAYLVVEGKNDRHVIWHLCEQHQLPEIFSVEVPGDTEGIDALLDGLPIRLKAENLRTLGIVADANQSLHARWAAIQHRLMAHGYDSIPERPLAEGWISAAKNLPRVGVWLMPDNQLPGMLEDFAARLIPPDDALLPKANVVLLEIEQAELNRYPTVHHSKALIHTWLAWQENPGMPMGQAITARTLRHDSTIARSFVAWLMQLFEVPSE